MVGGPLRRSSKSFPAQDTKTLVFFSALRGDQRKTLEEVTHGSKIAPPPPVVRPKLVNRLNDPSRANAG